MLQSAFVVRPDPRIGDAPARLAGSISMLLYRSRAVSPPTQTDLERLLRQARARNRAEGLTGLLIYDAGCYFQWLEGPPAGLARVWESIGRDPRHRDAQVLRQQDLPKRFFGSWDLCLAQRGPADRDDGFTVLAPGQVLPRGRAARSALPAHAWEEIFANVVVPRLKAAHVPAVEPVSIVWHADADAPVQLAAALVARNDGATGRYIDGLLQQGAGLETLYAQVFEPAARHLGSLWHDDVRTELELVLGLSRLQIELRRVNAAIPHPLHHIKPANAILVAPQPGEAHGLTAAMSGELFWRDGWDVTCEFPANDRALGELLHDHWFDVLDLSLSGACRREHRLHDMNISIRAARAASLNPALAVMVNGRTFVERRHACFGIGADAGCVTVVESVDTARRLIDARAMQRRIESTLLDPRRDARIRPMRVNAPLSRP